MVLCSQHYHPLQVVRGCNNDCLTNILTQMTMFKFLAHCLSKYQFPSIKLGNKMGRGVLDKCHLLLIVLKEPITPLYQKMTSSGNYIHMLSYDTQSKENRFMLTRHCVSFFPFFQLRAIQETSIHVMRVLISLFSFNAIFVGYHTNICSQSTLVLWLLNSHLWFLFYMSWTSNRSILLR